MTNLIKFDSKGRPLTTHSNGLIKIRDYQTTGKYWSKSNEEYLQQGMQGWRQKYMSHAHPDKDYRGGLNMGDFWSAESENRINRQKQIDEDNHQILGASNTKKEGARVSVGAAEGSSDAQTVSGGRDEGGGKRRGKAASKMLGFK